MNAGQQATLLWNATPCDSFDGDDTTVDYFVEVECRRYEQHPWIKPYFGFAEFAGKRVLEVGIGHGSDLLQFAKSGAECHGIDITDRHLNLTERNFRLHGSLVRLNKADATAIPYPDEYFDAVYSLGVIHHIPEADAVMHEIRRVLKPGGELMIGLYYRWSAFHIFTKLLCHGLVFGRLFKLGYAGLLSTVENGADGVTIKPYVKLYSRRSMRKLLAGFVVNDVSIQHLYADHFWPRQVASAVRPWIAKLESRFGWYVTARANKPLKNGS